MEYEKIVHCIESKRRFGNLPGVKISKKLLAAIENPQKELAFVHIAGTNGKGSTAAFLREILKEAGIKAGLFTSPHLMEFTERIQINGEQISKEDVVRIGSRLLELKLDCYPTMFDYCFAMAMLYFKEQNCQLVILETGLGGRLDATNSIDVPLVSIITKIGYDHTAILGDTLEKIAKEKAGILKTGTTAVIESQTKEIEEIFASECQRCRISCKIIDKTQILPMENGFIYEGGSYRLKMLGSHQRENAVAGILAARDLKKHFPSITENAIEQGIANGVWKGRMELISEAPFLLIDGAHNENGVEALTQSLMEMYPNEKFHFIMGVLADKNYKEMAEKILPIAKDVVTVTPESSRALEGKALAEYIQSFGVKARVGEQIKEVLKPFLEKDKDYLMGEKTIVFGSLYFIGDIEKLFCEYHI